jgi:hypothetical protein
MKLAPKTIELDLLERNHLVDALNIALKHQVARLKTLTNEQRIDAAENAAAHYQDLISRIAALGL